LLILWLRKNKNTRKNCQQCRRRPSSAFITFLLLVLFVSVLWGG
jgi:hypothetical protein